MISKTNKSNLKGREKMKTKFLSLILVTLMVFGLLSGLTVTAAVTGLQGEGTEGNPGRIVPVGEAVNYAVEKLGFPEYIKDSSGAYNQYSRSMYRDATCHLSIPCGRILAALCWYEYITGYDARENPYQNSSITPADMKLLKEAAHFACSQSDYKKP